MDFFRLLSRGIDVFFGGLKTEEGDGWLAEMALVRVELERVVGELLEEPIENLRVFLVGVGSDEDVVDVDVDMWFIGGWCVQGA